MVDPLPSFRTRICVAGTLWLCLKPVAEIRRRLRNAGMYGDEAPEDEEVRESYNFAPGYFGLVYRADVPDWGAGERDHGNHESEDEQPSEATGVEKLAGKAPSLAKTRYKFQSMKWGLIPFWTKRNPDYASMLKTINCRDDSLIDDRGMWTSMKKKKRCVVICQGFYEWLKKNNGRERLPHYIKRKDEKLMCFAGLWDCVKYEGAEDKLYTYTIITTSSNKQLQFLHDRMPVILDEGSDALTTWLDPYRSKWSADLQLLLKPYQGELEIYPVSKDVGKVGNNSPAFIIPIDSPENKNNIANFFGKAKGSPDNKSQGIKLERKGQEASTGQNAIKSENIEDRDTVDHDGSENNAPLPVPSSANDQKAGLKRGHGSLEQETPMVSPSPTKSQKTATFSTPNEATPSKLATAGKKRSATSNAVDKSPRKVKLNSVKAKDGSQKITNFFGK